MIVFLMIGVMIIFSIMGTRRERKKREAMINSIKKHDKVQTIGGVIGSIVELKPDFVVLKVDESSNTRITFARSAIQQIIKSSTVTTAENDE
ncbi:MAG TPA: preprotein translocase subunit YajC [Phycisphaerales bacterium]|nr:preprotein translocase subunit YajC [Phycisphaerales bacterium]